MGDAGNDTLKGGGGNDLLAGGAGNDYIEGGEGIDTASYSTTTGSVRVNLAVTTAQSTGGAGSDTLTGIENLVGGSGNDTLTGNDLASACLWCGISWAALDAQVRKGLA